MSIYVTGDCHADFSRFAKYARMRLLFELAENDYVIICGDFGLLWKRGETFREDCKWLSELPFRILWVQGNHENYDMIEEYPLEQWSGGKVRHIVQDRVILLERGQVFEIEGKKIFTFGGASSHDVQGGILDPESPNFKEDLRRAFYNGGRCRIRHESWWEQELPTEKEIQEGRDNLEKAGYRVDYVISHCLSDNMQQKWKDMHVYSYKHSEYKTDILTRFFDEVERCLSYEHWYCGHYHENVTFDERHTVLYETILPLGETLKAKKW